MGDSDDSARHLNHIAGKCQREIEATGRGAFTVSAGLPAPCPTGAAGTSRRSVDHHDPTRHGSAGNIRPCASCLPVQPDLGKPAVMKAATCSHPRHPYSPTVDPGSRAGLSSGAGGGRVPEQRPVFRRTAGPRKTGRRRAPRSCIQPLSRRSGDDDLHPAVLRFANAGAGGHQRIRFAKALRGDGVGRHAVLDQFRLHRVGAADRQSHVVLRRA